MAETAVVIAGAPLVGKASTLRALADIEGVSLTHPFPDGARVLAQRSGDLTIRTITGQLFTTDPWAELLATADLAVVTIDTQPRSFPLQRDYFDLYRSSLRRLPRIYQINKTDIVPASAIEPFLPEFGWEPRMQRIETSLHPVIRGAEALWKAIRAAVS